MIYKYIIGIDTGVNTGIAVYDVLDQKYELITSLAIHKAFLIVSEYKNKSVLVKVEDARLRKWLPKGAGRERLQGAGSIKRDAKIWEDFLTDLNVDYKLVAPKNNATKLDSKTFAVITGIHNTNEHSRDAGALCFPYITKYSN